MVFLLFKKKWEMKESKYALILPSCPSVEYDNIISCKDLKTKLSFLSIVEHWKKTWHLDHEWYNGRFIEQK